MACCLSYIIIYIITFYTSWHFTREPEDVLFWLSHYTRAQYKTRKETNVLIIVVMYLVLLFRESLKGGWGWVRGWLSTNLISPPTFCPDSSDSNFASNHIFGDKKARPKSIPSKVCTFLV